MRKRYSEKKFDVWRFEKNEREVFVEVKSFKNGNGEYRVPTDVGFVARCEELGIALYGTDLAVLQKDVKEKVEAELSVVFTPKMLITISGYARKMDYDCYRSVSAKAEITIDRFEYFEDETRKLRRNGEKDTPKTFFTQLGWSNGRSAYYALIDDSEENRRALEEILEGFSRLNARLQELLATDDIEQNLKLITTNPLKLLK